MLILNKKKNKYNLVISNPPTIVSTKIFQCQEWQALAQEKFLDEIQNGFNLEENLTKMALLREKRNEGNLNPEAMQTETAFLPGKRNESGFSLREDLTEMTLLREKRNEGQLNPEAMQTEIDLIPGKRNVSLLNLKERQTKIIFFQEEKIDLKKISV